MSDVKYSVWFVGRSGNSGQCIVAEIGPLGVPRDTAESCAQRLNATLHPVQDRGDWFEVRPIEAKPVDVRLDVKWAERTVEPSEEQASALARAMKATESWEIRVGDEVVARNASDDGVIRIGNLAKGEVVRYDAASLILPAGHEVQSLHPQAEQLARALFATDERIEAFVASKSEGRDGERARVLGIAWDRDEHGVKTESLARAAKMVAYENEQHPMLTLLKSSDESWTVFQEQLARDHDAIAAAIIGEVLTDKREAST